MEDISKAYKSLRKPDFSFVESAVARNPYQGVVLAISERFLVREITDSNDDVSFCYQVENSGDSWTIQLSMVGPYAVILKQTEEYGVEVVEPETQSRLERELCSILHANQLIILNQFVMEEPIDIHLFNSDPKNTRFYQALFTDTDILPWTV